MTTETERWKGLCRKVIGALNRRSVEYEESQRELAFARNEFASKCAEVDGLEWRVEELEEENAKLRALCRDMYLVVELLDMDGMALQAHGKSSDWRTLKERYDELTGVEE